MATREEFFKGKAKWCHLVRPDPKYGAYSLMLYPDAESLDKINKLKSGKPAILNELRKDEDGEFLKIKRDAQKMMRGQLTQFPPPIVTRADGTLLTDTWIGNGSDVTVGVEVYTYRKGEGLAMRLKSVRADNLVPFTPVTQNAMGHEGMAKQYGGMADQPPAQF